jgi:hypothetical protein
MKPLQHWGKHKGENISHPDTGTAMGIELALMGAPPRMFPRWTFLVAQYAQGIEKNVTCIFDGQNFHQLVWWLSLCPHER